MYYAGFDTSELSGLGSITLATAGESDAVVTISNITGVDQNGSSTTRYFHFHGDATSTASVTSQGQDGATALTTFCNNNFLKRTQAFLRTAAGSAGWTNFLDIDVDIDPATGLVTFGYSPANFSVTWSTSTGRDLYGFSGNQSGSTSYTSDQLPTYVIDPELDLVSVEPGLDGFNYEPEAVGNHLVADNGRGYGVARETSPVYRDWVQQFETKAKTLRLSATSAHPWTHQHLREHCRGSFPFLVYDLFDGAGTSEVFYLRSESTSFRPRRAAPAWDVFHVPYRCVVVGTAS